MNWDLYLAREWEKRKYYLLHAREYVKKIKDICVKEIDPECRVILFGSVARGNFRIDSDVDVLVITKVRDEIDRARVSQKLHDAIGVREPFEIHIVTKEEYENWYKRFIDVYEEY
ncbi:nucleotidyltransferase domain-containing protein [Sulfurisphaera javensis]|uniref:Nucleotidyltransferase domain-containing protein n=1 Tax=Sulfurisphaera javensis TaxID=2049879 RepID=A0AAT9GV99_9CREN